MCPIEVSISSEILPQPAKRIVENGDTLTIGLLVPNIVAYCDEGGQSGTVRGSNGIQIKVDSAHPRQTMVVKGRGSREDFTTEHEYDIQAKLIT